MTRNLSAPRQRWAVSRIRRPGWALVGFAGGLLFLAACATAPEERYFRVDPALPAPRTLGRRARSRPTYLFISRAMSPL